MSRRNRQKDRQMTEIHTEKDRQVGRGRGIHTERRKSRKKTVTEIADRQKSQIPNTASKTSKIPLSILTPPESECLNSFCPRTEHRAQTTHPNCTRW